MIFLTRSKRSLHEDHKVFLSFPSRSFYLLSDLRVNLFSVLSTILHELYKGDPSLNSRLNFMNQPPINHGEAHGDNAHADDLILFQRFTQKHNPEENRADRN